MKYTLSLVRPEDNDSLPEGMVDVQDEFGNSYGPFDSEGEAYDFIINEIELQLDNGNEVTCA
jgi:hypothetical protein